MKKKLSPAQQAMLDKLKSYGPLDAISMMIFCGKTWYRTWIILEAQGLVRYVRSAKRYSIR